MRGRKDKEKAGMKKESGEIKERQEESETKES